MNDGDGEPGQDNDTSLKTSRVSGGDVFGRAVAKVAIAQICDSRGFHSSHRSALDVLSEIAIRYICDLGKNANFYANLAGRTSCNVFDVIQGLEDLSLAQGFSGASEAHHCLVSSGVVREITHFVNTTEEVPFAKSISSFPINRVPVPAPTFAQDVEVVAEKHIPDWLPKFPDPHTYLQTPFLNEQATEAKKDKFEQVRQRRKAERSLLNLQQRLASNDSAGFGPITHTDGGKGKQVVGNNPFLAPPLPYGEKVVSEITGPSDSSGGRKVTLLEAFAPAIEAAKVGSFEFNTSDKTSLPQNRQPLQFKIGLSKKSVATSLFPSSVHARTESWPLKEGERDEKKRRAELILKEALEKPHDLAQL